MTYLEQIDACAAFLKGRLPCVPDRAVVLGSGLGGFADRLSERVHIPYADIPGFPPPTVVGHRGELIFGYLGATPLLAFAGRFHAYEGHPMTTVVLPVRVLARLGLKTLLLTNAAGGVNTRFIPGDLMLITDHLNLSGMNPLTSENLDVFGVRFPDMSTAYAPHLRSVAQYVAQEAGLALREGVYAWMRGPSYETPAEIRMLRTLGADAVGMSTVPEVIAAVHAGIDVLGISLITNMAAGVLHQALSHSEVTETAARSARAFESLVAGLLVQDLSRVPDGLRS